MTKRHLKRTFTLSIVAASFVIASTTSRASAEESWTIDNQSDHRTNEAFVH